MFDGEKIDLNGGGWDFVHMCVCFCVCVFGSMISELLDLGEKGSKRNVPGNGYNEHRCLETGACWMGSGNTQESGVRAGTGFSGTDQEESWAAEYTGF